MELNAPWWPLYAILWSTRTADEPFNAILSIEREVEVLDCKASFTSNSKCSLKNHKKTRMKETQNLRKHNYHMLEGGSKKEYILSQKINY